MISNLRINLPLFDSLQTIPSRMTEVPGSQGPRQSGSVITPTLHVTVPTLHFVLEERLQEDDDDDIGVSEESIWGKNNRKKR